MACYRGWAGWQEGVGTGGEDEWEAGGGLNSLLGLFGLVISPRSVSHRFKDA